MSNKNINYVPDFEAYKKWLAEQADRDFALQIQRKALLFTSPEIKNNVDYLMAEINGEIGYVGQQPIMSGAEISARPKPKPNKTEKKVRYKK